MASQGGVRAGKAFVELYADSSKLVRGLRSASKSLKSWGTSISGLGRTIFLAGSTLAAPLLASAKIFSSMGSDLADMASRTGVSVEALSTLGFAARQAGADTETLETALKKMQRTIGGAMLAGREEQRTLADLGLTLGDLAGLSPEDQFRLIGKQLSTIEDPAQKAAAAIAIFGRSGTRMIPMLTGLSELEAQARELGLVISTEDAAAADEFGDSLSSLWVQLKAVTFQVGAALAPTLLELAGTFRRTMKAVIDFVTRNRAMIVTTAKIVAGVVVVGAAITAMGTMIFAAGSLLGGTLTLIAAALAFLVSPIGLVVASLGALAAWFLKSTQAGQTLFGALTTDAVAAMAGVRDAIMAGDLSLAMRVAGNLLKLEWQKAIAFLHGYWIAFTEVFASAWTDAVFRISRIWTNASAGLQAAWQQTTDFIADAWSLTWGAMKKTFFETIGFIKSAWIRLQKLFGVEIDVGVEVAKIDAETARKIGATDESRDAAIFAREQERQKQLAAIEAARVGALDELQKAQAAKNLARQEAAAAKLAGTEADLVAAQAEFRRSTEEAAAKRKAVEEAAARKVGKGGTGIAEGIRQAGATTVAGTFSAAAVRGLGATVWSEIRAATKETAQNTKRIADRDDEVGLGVA